VLGALKRRSEFGHHPRVQRRDRVQRSLDVPSHIAGNLATHAQELPASLLFVPDALEFLEHQVEQPRGRTCFLAQAFVGVAQPVELV
jgi:hypothetical protein